ncbi:MAG: hypothetical protein M3Q56_08195 [Bacteroidota bacterium]|nr:hypothetical protein [Bacteroidota bacterium]
MRFRWTFLIIILLFNISSAQKQKLIEYIREDHSFFEIAKLADKMVKRHKMEDADFRKEFRKGKKNKEFLDDEKVKLERWKWYWRDRVHPDGSFPDGAEQSILRKYAIKEAANFNHRQAVNWKHEGPTRNTGGYWGMGRTTGIAFHPTQINTWFVSAPNGGVWKTTTGGNNFISLGENLPIQQVGIIIVDPRNPNIMYISLGEKEGWWQYGMGVYKTTDGGLTWNPTQLNWKLTDNKVVFELIMNPLNSSVLIAATNNGIYKTTNGGGAWTRIQTEDFSDVKYKPGDTSVVYAARNDYWGSCEVFRSTNGGNSFAQISNFNMQKGGMRLQVTPADPQYLGVNHSVDGQRRFVLSKDGGQSFNYVSDMPENLVMYFSPINKNIVYCGYVNTYRSFDGGKTWNQMSQWHGGTEFPEVHADHHYIAHHPLNVADIFFCCDGGVYRYNEPTQKWSEFQNGLPITQFYKMAISTTNPPVLIGGSQDNGGFIRRANNSWDNTNGGDAMWQLIDPTNANIGYTEYWGGTAVYATTDGFKNLNEISQNIPGDPQGQWVTPFELNPRNPRTFIIGYHDIYVSYNRGNTFSALSNNLTGAEDKDLRNILINPLDTQTLMATRANLIYISRDYGNKWTTVTMTLNNEISDIEAHSKDTNRLWVTRSGFGQLKIQESKDRGNTWKNITGNFLNTPAICIAFDEASNILLVGTDIGVFYSDADNINWQYYGSGLPHTSVTDIEIHQISRKAYISTYGRGFYSIPLPDCAPSFITLLHKVDGGNFASKDTIQICVGNSVNLKLQETNLKGSYRWRGPLSFDTVLTDIGEIRLNLFSSIQRSGNYTLEFTSEKSCVRVDTIYIKVNNNPRITTQSTGDHFNCILNEIQLSTNVSGDANFLFEWIGPNSFSSSDNVALIKSAGIYTVKSTNKNTRCYDVDSIVIGQYIHPGMSISTSDVVCPGASTGTIRAVFNGSYTPIKIQGENRLGQDSIVDAKAGIYVVSVLDSEGCTSVDTILISEPPPFDVQTQITHTSNNTGSIQLTVAGATGPYLYEWFKDSTFISDQKNLDQLEPGFYTVRITDALHCIYELKDIEIKNTTSTDDNISNLVLVYPNPAKSDVYISVNSNDEILGIFMTTMNGISQPINFVKLEKNRYVINVKKYMRGEYILQVNLRNKQFFLKLELN